MSSKSRSLVLGSVCVATLGFVAIHRGGAQDDADTSAKLTSLLHQRRDTLRELVNVVDVRYRQGGTTEGAVIDANNRLLEAELDIHTAEAERVRAHEQLVENLRKLEQIAAARHQVALGSAEEFLAAKAARLKAEIELLRIRTQED